MKRILVAYDGEAPARRALDLAASLAHAFDATIALVSVVPVHPRRLGLDPWDDRTAHERQLQEARRILAGKGIEPELIEPYGDPAQTIERVAEERHFDTIVLGTRGLGSVARALEGSVSEHVATHATTTVIIAR